jgi:hypothetical protein
LDSAIAARHARGGCACLAAFPDPFPGVLRAANEPLLQGFGLDASAIVSTTPEARRACGRSMVKKA